MATRGVESIRAFWRGRDQVGGARPGSGHDHSDPATGLGKAFGHVPRTLLVSRQDVANRAVDQGVVGREDRAAGHPEDEVNPLVLEASHQ